MWILAGNCDRHGLKTAMILCTYTLLEKGLRVVTGLNKPFGSDFVLTCVLCLWETRLL